VDLRGPAVSGFVLDASVAASWALDEESGYAQATLGALSEFRATVPPIWPAEFLNALLSAERRGRLSAAEVAIAVESAGHLPVSVDSEAASILPTQALALARAERLTVYDACYLELAMRVGLPLATLDERLRAAAARVGVSVFLP